MNQFTKPINFVDFKNPVVKRWLIHMKRLVLLPLFSIFYVSYYRSLSDRAGEEFIRWLASWLQKYGSIFTTIYMCLGLYF